MTRPLFDSLDFKKNRLPGSLGYIIFFVPLIACRHSRFGKFCLNQGVWGCLIYASVSLFFALLNVLLGWLPIVGWLIRLCSFLAKAIVSCLLLYCAWNAYNGKAEPLPFVGSISLIR